MNAFRLINWTKINDNVHGIISFLSSKDKDFAKKFLRWYMSLEKSKTNIKETELQQWIIDGIPKMKGLIAVLNREIEYIQKMQQRVLTSPISIKLKSQKSKFNYQAAKNILNSTIVLIGCRDDINRWFLSMMKEYQEIYQIRSQIEFFENICINKQLTLLKMKN